jgi:hypothetical protein
MARVDTANCVRILVVGDADVGKSTFVHTLCAGNGRAEDTRQGVGCQLSLRVGADGLLEEFYDVAGSERFAAGRPLFYRSVSYDGIMLVHDLSEPATRASLARVWVPETMRVLGDVAATEASGRHESAGPHVRARGAAKELRSLWLHLRSRHARGGLTPVGALREAARLALRLARLVLNEYGVWTDAGIDAAAERELLRGCSVPVAVVGLKRDAASAAALRAERFGDEAGGGRPETMSISLVSFDAGEDAAVASFLRRAAEHARRKGAVASSPRSEASPHVSVALQF